MVELQAYLIQTDAFNPHTARHADPASSAEGRRASLRCGPAPSLTTSDLTPTSLIQLEDDIERSRMREAFWISVVVHMVVVIFLFMTPKMFPGVKGVVLLSPADMMRNQQMTYLDLPPDVQKAPTSRRPRRRCCRTRTASRRAGIPRWTRRRWKS